MPSPIMISEIIWVRMSASESSPKAIIMISHHSEMVHRVKPDFVHVLSNGKIERTGDITLIEEIQKHRIWKTKIRI